jgi:hypothetical protein
MGYDPQSNELRELTTPAQVKEFKENKPQFLFTVGEEITVKGVMFKVHDIGDNRIVLKPVRAV